MPQSICILDGHPDPEKHHLIHALCDAYADGAAAEGHEVSRIDIAGMDIPLLEKPDDMFTPPPEPILSEREKIGAADHLVIAFPLWMGGMPAKLRAFFEQAARGGYFVKMQDEGWPAQMMKGKSARVIVSMAMPGLVYRFGMDAGALKALERGILGLSGFRSVHHTIIGMAGDLGTEDFRSWQTHCRQLGTEGA
ncbi:MAG: NAD(P)H-dependent oxidoreductase [Hyphomonas sp.]|uniref:NAD(P)H-dependent oxidoreductase n=1 Tax=Hyphomonas sp. TaxID=87 RepID=UPI0035287D1D